MAVSASRDTLHAIAAVSLDNLAASSTIYNTTPVKSPKNVPTAFALSSIFRGLRNPLS